MELCKCIGRLIIKGRKPLNYEVVMLNCFEVYFTVTDRNNYTTVKRILTSTEESAIKYCLENFKMRDLVSIEQLTPKRIYCNHCGQYEETKHYSKQEIDNGTANIGD